MYNYIISNQQLSMKLSPPLVDFANKVLI